MTNLSFLRHWFLKHQDQIRDDYFHFLRFRSISTEPAFKSDVEECAKWVASYLSNSGFESKLIPTSGHPLVFGQKLVDPEKETLLIYGHYDVQPIDPIELWESDPFTPTERDDRVYARGAVDDKGQIFYAMLAMRALADSGQVLPVNIKFCIEGEEEAGSVGLSEGLSTFKTDLQADSLLVVDFDSYDETTPAINLGVRGMVTMQVTLTGSKSDLHSGLCGGIAYNPNRALVQLLAKLHSDDGQVAVDRFYDGVQEPTAEEKKVYPSHLDAEQCKKLYDLTVLGGEKGRTPHENNIFRPTLEINGIAGGYAGPGFKTVIPAKAVAKLSCRLVPNQDPIKVGSQVKSFLERHAVKGMKIDVEVYPGGAYAFRGNPNSKLAKAVSDASSEVCEKPCQKVLSGASIPVIAALSKALGVETVGMGYGLPSDQIHAPNEHFDFRRLELGFLTVASAIGKL
jgi:acetylornithine deacetylase/succinyl-diaminopimelate desuccinylase-like protein